MERENSKILFLFKKTVVADVFALAIEACMENCTTQGVQNVAELQAELKSHKIFAIVSDFSIMGSELQVLKNELNIPIFLLSNEDKTPEWAQSLSIHWLPAEVMPTELVEKITKEVSLSKAVTKYCRLPVRSLLNMGVASQCDVYVKISESKYIKIANANESLERARLEKFLSQGTDQLYMLRTDFLKTIDAMAGEVFKLLVDPQKITLETAVSTTNAIFNTIHAAFEVEGFTPKVARLAEASIQLAVQAIQKNPKLSDILKNLVADKNPYVAWHSNALAFMSCKLATLLGWNSDATFYKLSMASMLHDITIKDDNLARLNTLSEIKNANLSDEQMEAIVQHPFEASELVLSFEELPGEVGFIVEQHHELPGGDGFPNQVSHNEISSISALFIISHDIVDALGAQKDQFDFGKYIAHLEKERKYMSGSYGQVFRVIANKYLEAF